VTRLILALLFQSFIVIASAQNADSIPKKNDSTRTISRPPVRDSLRRFNTIKPAESLKKDSSIFQSLDTSWKKAAAKYSPISLLEQLIKGNQFLAPLSKPVAIETDKKIFKGKEDFFYSIVALLLFFAFVKNAFPKYLNDLFRVAFRRTLKQRQLGEQLVQTPLPSLFMNIFFLISGAMYLDLLFRHYQFGTGYSFWLLYFYIAVALGVIYLVKYITLKLSGLLFNISQTTDAYIFIVFMINKIMSVLLLPFLVLLAFTNNEFYKIGLVLSFITIFILLAYRFILAYGLVRNQIRVKPFHFFLYLCCFEIAPLLLIYKLLLLWV
jgi:hypothetical protein